MSWTKRVFSEMTWLWRVQKAIIRLFIGRFDTGNIGRGQEGFGMAVFDAQSINEHTVSPEVWTKTERQQTGWTESR